MDETFYQSLDYDPEVRAKELAIPVLVNQAAELMQIDNAESALAKYKEAQEFDAQLEQAYKRQGWVDALNQGENPFAEEVLRELLGR